MRHRSLCSLLVLSCLLAAPRPARALDAELHPLASDEELVDLLEEVNTRLVRALPAAERAALSRLTLSLSRRPGLFIETLAARGALPGHVHLSASRALLRLIDQLALQEATRTLPEESEAGSLSPFYVQLRLAALAGVVGHALGHVLLGPEERSLAAEEREQAADARFACAATSAGLRHEGVLLWPRLLATLEQQPELAPGLRQAGVQAMLEQHPRAAQRAPLLARRLVACSPPRPAR